MAGAARFSDAMAYDAETQNRAVIEQKLNLTHEDKQKIYSYLLWKTEESKRSDKYDPVQNNCATAVRDVLKLVWTAGIAENHFLRESSEPLTPRALILAKLSENPWAKITASLFAGCSADRAYTLQELAFMPDVLRSVLAVSKTKANGDVVPLVKSTTVIAEGSARKAKKAWDFAFIEPSAVFLLIGIFAAVFTAIEIFLILICEKSGKRKFFSLSKAFSSTMQALDILLFLFTGLLGTAIFFAALFSKSQAFLGNINFLWLLPANTIASVFCAREKSSRILSAYFLSCAYLCVFVLIFREKLPQEIDGAFSPLIFAIAVRAAFQAVSRPMKAMLQVRALFVKTQAKSSPNTTGR